MHQVGDAKVNTISIIGLTGLGPWPVSHMNTLTASATTAATTCECYDIISAFLLFI